MILKFIQEKTKYNMNRILKFKVWHITRKMLFVAMFVGLGLASCTYYTNDFVPTEVPDPLSFEEHIIPIFETNCNNPGCHSGTIAPDLRPDVAYDDLINGEYVSDASAAENNLLYQKISNGGSMEGFATDENRAYIKKWIEDGFENN